MKNWIKEYKSLIIVASILILPILLGYIAYCVFAHRLITAMYEGASLDFLNKLIGDKSIYPLDYYLKKADKFFVGFPIFIISTILSLCLLNIARSIYSTILNISEFCLRRKKTILLSGSLILIIIVAAIAIFILQDFPNSADEYVYIYQAKTYLAGRFWNTPHPLQNFFKFIWIEHRNNKLFGLFPPGWPLVLATAIFLKLPICLVNPILGASSLLMIYFLGKKLYDEKIAFLSTVFIAFSSFYLFNSASYFSHTLCSLLLLLFAYYFICFIENGKIVDGLLVGSFFGGAFITRPYTVTVMTPVFIYLIFAQKKQLRKLIWPFVGFMPFVLFLLLYNYKVTGNALVLASNFAFLETKSEFGIYFEGLFYVFKNLLNFMLWTMPFIFIIFLYYLPYTFKEPRKNAIGLIYPCLVAGHLIFTYSGGNQYGPRYYYEGFPFLILFTVSRLFKEEQYEQKSIIGKYLFSLFILSLIINIQFTISHLIEERKVVWERTDLYRLVKKEKIENAVVFLRTGTGAIRPMLPDDLTRNDLDYSNSVLYALDLGMNNEKLKKYYPHKEYYIYYYDRVTKQGHLDKL